MTSFAGQVAFVTGGARGIGAAVAAALAKAGASVVIVDRDGDAAADMAESIVAKGGTVVARTCDLTVEQEVAAAVAFTVDHFGRLDLAFNNAGIGGTKGKKAADLDLEEWSRLLSINLTSVFLCMKYQLKHMASHGGGVIVNTSSTAGVASSINSGVGYSASKHGVVGLTRTAAKEYMDQNVRVTAICPGGVATSLLESTIGTDAFNAAQEKALIAQPDDIADTVLWLMSPASRFFNAQPLILDGGRIL